MSVLPHSLRGFFGKKDIKMFFQTFLKSDKKILPLLSKTYFFSFLALSLTLSWFLSPAMSLPAADEAVFTLQTDVIEGDITPMREYNYTALFEKARSVAVSLQNQAPYAATTEYLSIETCDLALSDCASP